MPERGKYPEIYFTPEHWDGHLLDRSCCKDKPSKNISRSNSNVGILSTIRENIKARRISDQAWKELRGLMDTGQETVIRSYSEDDQFNAENHADGAILRIQGEILDGRFLLIPEYYADRTYYGRLNRSFKFQASPAPFVVYFQAIPFPERTVLLDTPRIAFSPTKVGEVEHTYTGLSRINKIDVVRLGLSETQKLDQQEKLPTLIPEFSSI